MIDGCLSIYHSRLDYHWTLPLSPSPRYVVGNLVKRTVKTYLRLDNARQLCQYVLPCSHLSQIVVTFSRVYNRIVVYFVYFLPGMVKTSASS